MLNVNYGTQISNGDETVGRIVRVGDNYVVYLGNSRQSFKSYVKAVKFLRSLG